MSYLLVAILPGEVQEARGEQLIFGPGITVHGARASRVGVEESAGFLCCKRFFCCLIFAFPRRACLPACLSAPLASPSGAVEAVKRTAAVCWLLLSPRHVGGFSQKTEWDAFEGDGSQSGVRGPHVGVSCRVNYVPTMMEKTLNSQVIHSIVK